MKYTGERVIPAHGDNPGVGNFVEFEHMYKDYLTAVENKTIVDVACGTGYGSKILAEKATKVYGYDIDAETIEFAKEHMAADNIEYAVANIKNLPIETGSIDVAVSIETFEHVTEIQQVINEIYRILKPNGFWFFTTPNAERYPNHRVVKWHVKHYTKIELYELMAKRFTIHINEIGFEPDTSLYYRKPTFGNYAVSCVKIPMK